MAKSNENVKKSELEKEFWNHKIPFAIDIPRYHSFSQRNTIFSRVRWDKSFRAYKRQISEKQARKAGEKGYSHEGYAAQVAAWTLYDKFPFAFSWERIPFSSQSTETQLTSKLSESLNINKKENSKLIKRVGQIFGADDIGICKISPDFIYSDDEEGKIITLPSNVNNAIVILIRMDSDALKTSPALPASIATGEAYSRMAYVIALLGEFIRNLGYKAIQAGNDVGISVPIAIEAGLGEFGRHGLLIHPKYGPNVRICKIFTDLPLEYDEPVHFGVSKYCRSCRKCAKYCPSNSITYERNPTWESEWNTPSNNSGATYKWFVNVETCYHFWVMNSADCSNCISVCFFGRESSSIIRIVKFFIRYFPILNPLWVLIDGGKGKRKIHPSDLWEMEENHNMTSIIKHYIKNPSKLFKIPFKKHKSSKKWWTSKSKDPDKFWNSKSYLDKKLP